MKNEIELSARVAAQAANKISRLTNQQRTLLLQEIADQLESHTEVILEANQEDLALTNLGVALTERMTLSMPKIKQMAEAIRQVAAFDDPLGRELAAWERPNGIRIKKVSTPIGVIAMIYESRPNVTSDATALCLRSGNAIILKGGSECLRTNQAIVAAINKAESIPTGAVTFLAYTDRKAVEIICQQDKYVDLIIPRGGAGLITAVKKVATVPVIKHDAGICHIYVDAAADLLQAEEIIINAKCQRPGVCNSIETLLIHQQIAEKFVPQIQKQFEVNQVEVVADSRYQEKLQGVSKVEIASEDDWSTEYLDLKISVRIVADTAAAIEHINQYGSGHTDAILTRERGEAEKFFLGVNSASVFHNLSTRFADGEEYGFGAEIGISTDKIHARGPMGVSELTTYQYQVCGSGQVRT